MLISVIVPVFNAENYLHYAMESLEKQIMQGLGFDDPYLAEK